LSATTPWLQFVLIRVIRVKAFASWLLGVEIIRVDSRSFAVQVLRSNGKWPGLLVFWAVFRLQKIFQKTLAPRTLIDKLIKPSALRRKRLAEKPVDKRRSSVKFRALKTRI
jgi:hypothetical protein